MDDAPYSHYLPHYKRRGASPGHFAALHIAIDPADQCCVRRQQLNIQAFHAQLTPGCARLEVARVELPDCPPSLQIFVRQRKRRRLRIDR